ncbi:CPBP family intramembrane metalloprotease [Mucilaginibacter sp. BJC16-A38]|uniref:CPBP family intramembrane glutamic endopeptidase n=1 Tax=Mucilaginibacter phenanthrenivorans TaxID=1234842 RepID=UPI00215807E3|nr:CPBP family intramembrane glutamic endopeptidase [Mucilaginibacter phenanthrenivorans]MCR8557589.1 CPBP family intramembrane metalloprotease [Mucilaginibacter phenanthrenivorans]
MIAESKQTERGLSPAKTILFAVACVAIFVVVAVICELLTSWITINPLKIVTREVFLRTPLTIFALHLFAKRVIRAYDPGTIYGKLLIVNALKWIALGLLLPVTVGIFYYLLHFMVPFQHTVPLNLTDKLGVFAKWAAVSIAAGITEEVLFRGHLFMIINSRYSKLQAVLISSLVFGVVHIVMLTSFGAQDILIVVFGGIIAGTVFSLIYQYTKVIWYAAIFHVMWDIFFIGKITTLAATQADANQAIMAFKLTAHSLLLTGGNFGIEGAVPCLTVYIILGIALYKRIQKRDNVSAPEQAGFFTPIKA